MRTLFIIISVLLLSIFNAGCTPQEQATACSDSSNHCTKAPAHKAYSVGVDVFRGRL